MARSVTFEKNDKNEWFVDVDGEYAGDLTRERPTRFSMHHGVVQDRNAAWLWNFSGQRGFEDLDLADGLTIAQAKAAVRDHLA